MKKADVKALKDAISKAEDVKEENVTPSSWKRVQSAKTAAEDVLKAFEKDDESVTQEQIDSAAKALNDALASVQNRADFSKLQEAINRIEKLDLEGYTKDSVNVLKEALREAKGVLENKESTQQAVEEVLTKLLAAEEGLTKAEPEDPNKPVEPEDPNKPVEPEDPNKPVEPENPNKPENPSGSNRPAKTGDTSPIAETGAIMLAAAAVVLVWRKRNR